VQSVAPLAVDCACSRLGDHAIRFAALDAPNAVTIFAQEATARVSTRLDLGVALVAALGVIAASTSLAALYGCVADARGDARFVAALARDAEFAAARAGGAAGQATAALPLDREASRSGALAASIHPSAPLSTVAPGGDQVIPP
jgi:hypothetical protein